MYRLLIVLLLLASCVSPARTWHVDNVDSCADQEVIDVAMAWLPLIWERWPVEFKIEPTGTDGVIEVSWIEWGNTIGRALPGCRKLKGPFFGIFYKGMKERNNLSNESLGQWLALVISHEVAHAYGLYLHHDKVPCLMNKNVPRRIDILWCDKAIKHFDKVLGVKKDFSHLNPTCPGGLEK